MFAFLCFSVLQHPLCFPSLLIAFRRLPAALTNILSCICISAGREHWLPLDCGGWGRKVFSNFLRTSWSWCPALFFQRDCLKVTISALSVLVLWLCWFLVLYTREMCWVGLWSCCTAGYCTFQRIRSTFLPQHQVNWWCLSEGFLCFTQKNPKPRAHMWYKCWDFLRSWARQFWSFVTRSWKSNLQLLFLFTFSSSNTTVNWCLFSVMSCREVTQNRWSSAD